MPAVVPGRAEVPAAASGDAEQGDRRGRRARAGSARTAAGCGLFDSSHELHCGLLVIDHRSQERVAKEVPLGWWLDWQGGPPKASMQRWVERLGRAR